MVPESEAVGLGGVHCQRFQTGVVSIHSGPRRFDVGVVTLRCMQTNKVRAGVYSLSGLIIQSLFISSGQMSNRRNLCVHLVHTLIIYNPHCTFYVRKICEQNIPPGRRILNIAE